MQAGQLLFQLHELATAVGSPVRAAHEREQQAFGKFEVSPMAIDSGQAKEMDRQLFILPKR